MKKKIETVAFFSVLLIALFAVAALYFWPFLYAISSAINVVVEFFQQAKFLQLPKNISPLVAGAEKKLLLNDIQHNNIKFIIFVFSKFFNTALKTFTLAIAATLISFFFASIISATYFMSKENTRLTKLKPSFVVRIFHVITQKVVAIAMAFPHVAFVLALTFLLAPSGLFFRLFATLFNWNASPDVYLTGDNTGFFYVIVLAIREIPFLLFFILSENNKKNSSLFYSALMVGKANLVAWFFAVFPSIYIKLRLPILLVFAYSLCNVEVALIGGPQNPKLLSVHVFEFLYFFNSNTQNFASLLAIYLSFLLIIGIALLFFFEKIIVKLYKFFILSSRLNTFFARERKYKKKLKEAPFVYKTNGASFSKAINSFSIFSWGFIVIIFFFSLSTLVFWSISLRWPFPLLLPESYTSKFWLEALRVKEIMNYFNGLFNGVFNSSEKFSSLTIEKLLSTAADVYIFFIESPLGNSILLAGLSSFLALAIAIFCLEGYVITKVLQAQPHGSILNIFVNCLEKVFNKLWWLILLLLFLPELVVLPGIKKYFLDINLNYFIACVWGHFLFIFPYTYLTLRKWYLQFDNKNLVLARTMGKSYLTGVVKVKWAMLLRPILFVFALGATVSFSQYLSTLFFGGGRILTITTEAVNLFQSGNRRVVSVYAILQFVLPVVTLLFIMKLANKYDYEKLNNKK